MSTGRVFAAWVVGLCLVACGKDSSGPRVPTMTGTWEGSSAGTFITMTLTEANTNVTGSGTITDGSNPAGLTITGTHSHPQVTLTVTPAGYDPFQVTGTFSGADNLVAQLNGSGFSNFAMTFARK